MSTKNDDLKKTEDNEDLPEPVVGFTRFHNDFIQFLHADHGEFYNKNVKQLETTTSVKREQLAYAIIALNCIYMIIGSWAEFLCNMIGVAYPAYVSVKAIRTVDTSDDTQWLTYWAVFATFSIVDFFASCIMSVFPIYWVLKAAFLVYLYLPQTHGAKVLYVKCVDPLVTWIDKMLEPKKLPQKTE